MTTLRVGSVQIEKWIHQNKGNYTGNYVEGCLLDNYVLECKRGYAFVYEHYLNPNSSDYYIEFVPYKSAKLHLKEYDTAWARWLEFEEREATA